METDRPAVTLLEGGADVSYQIKVSRDVPGYTTANMHISPNPRELYSLDKIRPGPWDGDRFIYRDPGPHTHGDSTSLIVGAGGWKTVTFAAGQDADAHNHAITLYHRVSPRGSGWSTRAADEAPEFPNYERPETVGWPVLAGPDSREYSAPKPGLANELVYVRVSPCRRPAASACWTWPISVRIVDDDKWEQEVVYARHDPAANGGAGGPGAFVLASDGGLRKALPAALAPGSTYTFYVRLAVDPATLPKDGTVSRDQTVTEGGVTRRVDVYPPTFLPDRVPVWVRVKGARADRHGVPDVRLRITPHASAGVRPNAGAYFITDTSGTRDHPSVEADYDYRDNTPPGAKGSSLFWDEPMAVTVEVRGDAPLGAVRRVEVNSDSGLLTRPNCGRGWSKHNCTGDHFGYWFWDGWDFSIGLTEDLRPAAQRSAAGFSPRTPEEILEWAKQVNFGNEGELFTPFADVAEERGGIADGARASITEGETARFAVTLTPAPSEPRAVTVNVARRGGSTPIGVAAHLGPRTVMVGPSGSAVIEVPTADNDHVGANGYLHATVVASPTYRVSDFGGSAETDVLSDDAELVYDAVRVRRVTDTAAEVEWDPSPGAASYEVVWLEGTSTATSTAFTTGTSIELAGLNPATSYNVAVLDDLWNRVGSAELLTLAPGGGESVYPVLSVTAGGDIAEGGAASFTVTAVPAPSSPLTVTVWVSQRGDYAAVGERGERAVTVPTSGSVSLAVATDDDTDDEADGAIVATLERSKLGHHVGASARAEVAVVDDDDGSANPEVSVTAGGPVEEGGDASFTVTADPAPAQPLSVNVTVSQEGDFGATTGPRTVTVPVSGSATLSVATTDDDQDEPRGSVSVEVAAGDGYTVSSGQGRATVQVADNDDPTPEVSVTAGGGITEGGDAAFTVTADPPPSEPLKVSVTVAQTGDFGATTGARTVTVPVSGSATLTVSTTDDDADEADGSVTVTVEAGDGYTVAGGQGSATVSVSDDDDPPQTPEVSVTAGSGVTEGGDASFTVSASPAPTADLTVNVTVSQDGDHGATTGSRTVTVPASGSATLTVGTTDDSADEPDGSVSVALDAGDGYTVSATQGTATVSVADDDDPPPAVPEVNISGATSGEEGQDVTFTLSADPAPSAPLTVKVTVTAGGDFGVSTGSRTVTIPTSGSATLTVGTSDDDADEPNGSVTLTLNAGDGYTVGALSADTAPVLDNDDAPLVVEPEISVTAGSGVTEGGSASFTVTASPAPTADLTVNVTVGQSGEFGATTGSRTVTVPTSGSATLTVSTSDDGDDEADGSVSVTVDAGDGYTVSGAQGTATVNVSDDDDPPPTDLPEVSVADASVAEGDPHRPYLAFAVTLNEPADRRVVVRWEVRPGTAALLRDYHSLGSYRLVFQPGETARTAWVRVLDDEAQEEDETVELTLTRAVGATIARGTAVGTIIDND